MDELRFFVDHGVIHDRKRGRHVLGSESDAAIFGEPLQDTVDALNAMEAAAQDVGGVRNEYLDECRGAPVAWMARGACTGEPVFTTTPPDEPNVAGWTPLYARLPHNARSKRRRHQNFHSAQKQRAGVRLTELLGGSALACNPMGR